jgi:hypothetical protein
MSLLSSLFTQSIIINLLTNVIIFRDLHAISNEEKNYNVSVDDHLSFLFDVDCFSRVYCQYFSSEIRVSRIRLTV